MKPLHENMESSSSLESASETINMRNAQGNARRMRSSSSSCRRRDHSKRSSNNQILTTAPKLCLLFGLGCLLPLQFSTAAAQAQPPEPQQREQRNLLDGLSSCAGCNSGNLQCSGKSISDEHCGPCATGQTWWPCNLLDECYCKDLSGGFLEQQQEELRNCELPLCGPGESTTKVVPFTNCKEYVSCSNGVAGVVQNCGMGMAYSTRIRACNIVSQVTCSQDPECPPTRSPSNSRPRTRKPTTDYPTVTASPTFSTMGNYDSVGSFDGANGGAGAGRGDPNEPDNVSARPNPAVLEGMYVMDAHMAANKIVLTRELLTSPGRGPPSSSSAAMNDFSYMGLRSSLQTMITVGAANRTFYIGTPSAENGRAYGLVNIAAFLAMSVEDSISHGSCDEVNHDLMGGTLPISNACGQDGWSYQDMTCAKGEERYQCQVDPTMRATANDVDVSLRRNSGGTDDGRAPKPFYCGPLTDYDGYTGHWDYVSGAESFHPPVENGSGKTDVEGCCWWGRGAIQIRGVCAYGKLNYFLGKRAHDEGRPSMFPDIDFCRDPQAVCSNPNYPDLKWIAGMFRWITEVQTYNRGDYSYMQRLVDFVDGGLQDWTFVHGLSGIVTQGCHEPPCAFGVEFEDGASRKATFIRTLKLLGLSPGKSDGMTHTADGRRLGESSNR
mmetsp:Transcript_763/g.1605  ORF Transcript_763/g.1605 Transcript_763/m.1605 type:complete len:666 (+) Transcript_763:172-2169(+)